MDALKVICCCALFAVAGCVGAEPIDDADSESGVAGGEEISGDDLDVAPEPEALPDEDTPDAKSVCWVDQGISCCALSTGPICCFIEGKSYCS